MRSSPAATADYVLRSPAERGRHRAAHCAWLRVSGIEAQHPVRVRVGDQQAPAWIEVHAHWPRPAGADVAQRCERGVEVQHAIGLGVGDEHAAMAVRGDALRAVEPVDRRYTGPVGSEGPAVPSRRFRNVLALGDGGRFEPFTPGVAQTYTTTLAADVLSTAGEAILTVSDPSANATGHLVNGACALAQPLLVAGTPLPATVKTWALPVSHDPVTIALSQTIGANEPLRTGTYAKTVTFTLSATAP